MFLRRAYYIPLICSILVLLFSTILPSKAFADSEKKEIKSAIPAALGAQLKNAGQAFRQRSSSAPVRFSVQTKEGVFPVELVAHDIRSAGYRAERRTIDGVETDNTVVHLFKTAGANESSRYFTRFAFIEDESGDSTIVGYMRRGKVNYKVAQDKNNRSQFLVGALTDDEAEAIIASCLDVEAEEIHQAATQSSRNSTRATLKRIQLATDADYDYYTDEGSSSTANATILAIVNAADAIYRSDLSLSISVTFQNVWTTSSDPYTKSDAVDLLNEFRTYWNSNYSSSKTYDLAHLWTGRNLDGSTAGVAWVGASCSSYRYGLSQRYNSSGTTVPLFAHELGHNVGASHDSTPCASDDIMCPSLQFNADSFSTQARASIATHVASASCLSTYNTSTVNLSINKSSIVENSSGLATVTATLSSTESSAVTVNLDFSGTAINGTDYSPSASFITISAGATTGTMTLTSLTDALDEENETIIVDISSVTNSAENGTQQVTTTINDNDSPPTVSLSQSASSISETGGSSTITATLNAISGKDVTVNLGFSGSAAGTDYSASASSISIPAGSTSGTVTVNSTSDNIDETDETVVVSILSLSNATNGSPTSRTITINDDDSPPSVTISTSKTVFSETGGSTVLTATLSNPSASDVTVSLSYSGTASAGDYSAATSIIVSAYQNSANITISALSDSTDESDETVIVDVSSVTNGTESGTQRKTVTILDDDATPAATISASPSTVSENSGVSTVTANLSNPSDKTITINLSFSGTAVGADYTTSSSSITISPGNNSGSMTITGQDDSRDELNETVVVDISSVTNGVESGTQRETITLNDDDPTPTVSMTVSTNSIAEDGTTSTVTVTSSALSNLDIGVVFAFSGTAGAFDYGITASSFTILAGTLSNTITINSNGDLIDEGDETVIVDIATVTNGTESGTQTQTITIVDDDAGADISVDTKLTNDPTPSITGTIGTTTATIKVTVNGVTYNAINNANGTWTLADNIISPALADGQYEVIAESKTPSGVLKYDTDSLELKVDTTPPSTTVTKISTQDTTPGLSGTIDDTTATLTVRVNSITYPGTNNANGTWSLADNTISPALAEGVYEVLVTAQDVLGNSGTDSTNLELKIDLTDPVVTVDSLLTSVVSPEITGTVNETDASLSVLINGRTYTGTNNGDGTWRIAAGVISPLGLGTYEVLATATDPAGNSSTDATNNELVIEEPDTDSDGLKDSVDNCPNDSNAGQEDDDADGIGNVCDGSHALPSSPAFLKWTSFLKQWSFLELVVQGTSSLGVTVKVYNLSGRQMIQRAYSVAANSEVDVDINALVKLACESENPSSCAGLSDLDGDGMIDSYGLVRLDFDDTNPNATLIGRLSNYRPDPPSVAALGGSFSFALTRELRPLLRGKSYAVANTYDPQGLGYLVPNWSELTYIGALSGSGSMGFTINLYDQTGALKKSEYVVLNELQERDSAAGHDIVDSGTGKVVQAVYLVEVIPDDLTMPYLFSVTRYSSNAAAGFEPDTYNYSVTAPGRAGANGTLYSSINRELFSCGIVNNWVEVANTHNSPVTATSTFRNSIGGVVGTATEAIGAKAQIHYNASAMLVAGDIGSVEISSSVPGALIATSMVYILECDKTGIQTAYAAMAREVARKDQFGTANTFLSMGDTLRVISTRTTSQTVGVDLLTYLGEASSGSLVVSAKGATDELLSSSYTLPADRYGTTKLTGESVQSYLAEVIRMRFKEVGGKTRVDFVIPTQVN